MDSAALHLEQETLAPPAMDLEPIRLIRASAGNTIRLIAVGEVICLEAADKYVNVVTSRGECQVRMSLRELAARLQGIELVQIHRGVMVNLARMDYATRDELGFYNLRLHGLAKTIKVSRAFSHLFRPM